MKITFNMDLFEIFDMVKPFAIDCLIVVCLVLLSVFAIFLLKSCFTNSSPDNPPRLRNKKLKINFSIEYVGRDEAETAKLPPPKNDIRLLRPAESGRYIVVMQLIRSAMHRIRSMWKHNRKHKTLRPPSLVPVLHLSTAKFRKSRVLSKEDVEVSVAFRIASAMCLTGLSLRSPKSCSALLMPA